jgi:hypothetical protein
LLFCLIMFLMIIIITVTSLSGTVNLSLSINRYTLGINDIFNYTHFFIIVNIFFIFPYMYGTNYTHYNKMQYAPPNDKLPL